MGRKIFIGEILIRALQLQGTAGDIPGYLSELCRRQGDQLSGCQEDDLLQYRAALQPE